MIAVQTIVDGVDYFGKSFMARDTLQLVPKVPQDCRYMIQYVVLADMCVSVYNACTLHGLGQDGPRPGLARPSPCTQCPPQGYMIHTHVYI